MVAFDGGTGISSDPYIITTWEQLQFIETNAVTIGEDSDGVPILNPNDIEAGTDGLLSKHFKLGFNLYTNASDRPTNFVPIGTGTEQFRGSFDGDNYIISGLTIDRPIDHVGLFGICKGATIKNLTLTDVSVKGSDFAGGLSGQITSTIIDKCSVNGDIVSNTSTTTTVYAVGGLIGYSLGNSVIRNSLSKISVGYIDSYNTIGGLIGSLSSDTSGGASVINCYSMGELISGPVGGVEAFKVKGGLIGANEGGTITNSFWDVTASGISTSAGGTGKTTDDMKLKGTYIGWDFDEIWAITNSYPFHKIFEGTGTLSNPYIISNLKNLQSVNIILNASFKLDVALNIGDSDSIANFRPIGTASNPFSGNFNGNCRTVTGLTINRPDLDNVGLFGYCADGATIKNVTLRDANVKGKSKVGGLVGSVLNATISVCSTSGNVTAQSSLVGGLVGQATQAFASAKVINCYSHAKVTVNSISGRAGGLIGHSSSNVSVTNCYSTGSVNAPTGANMIGGLVSNFKDANVTSSYWDSSTSGISNDNVDNDKSTKDMMNISTYIDWDFTSIWKISTGYSYPFHYGLLDLEGSGTKSDPYIIKTWTNLQLITRNDLLGKHHKLMSNLGRDEVDKPDNFKPIGLASDKFTGKFNGNGYVISGLIIDRLNSDNVGLFGYCFDATIQNVALQDVNIKGKSRVGGLIGSMKNSVVSMCSTSGNVTAKNDYVGGLIGSVGDTGSSDGEDAEVVNSYSKANVTSQLTSGAVGGLIGSNINALVSNCYSNGLISLGSGASVEFGGLIGNYKDSLVANSYWDKWRSNVVRDITEVWTTSTSFHSFNLIRLLNIFLEVDTLPLSIWGDETTKALLEFKRKYSLNTDTFIDTPTANLLNKFYTKQILNMSEDFKIGKSTPEMNDKATYIDWDFDNIWGISHEYGTPYHLNLKGFDEGKGTDGDPYVINTWTQLQLIANDYELLDKHYIMKNHLNEDDSDRPVNFKPIGSSKRPFTGGFNGDGFTITGLTINRPTESHVGLFGYCSAPLDKITLITADVTGLSHVGGIAGTSTSSIILCSVLGIIKLKGNAGHVGGLIGKIDDGYILDCYSRATVVAGGDYIGGLTGELMDGAIIYSYFAGNLSYSTARNSGGLYGKMTNTGLNFFAASASYFDMDKLKGKVALGLDVTQGLTTGQLMNPNNLRSWDVGLNKTWDTYIRSLKGVPVFKSYPYHTYVKRKTILDVKGNSQPIDVLAIRFTFQHTLIYGRYHEDVLNLQKFLNTILAQGIAVKKTGDYDDQTANALDTYIRQNHGDLPDKDIALNGRKLSPKIRESINLVLGSYWRIFAPTSTQKTDSNSRMSPNKSSRIPP